MRYRENEHERRPGGNDNENKIARDGAVLRKTAADIIRQQITRGAGIGSHFGENSFQRAVNAPGEIFLTAHLLTEAGLHEACRAADDQQKVDQKQHGNFQHTENGAGDLHRQFREPAADIGYKFKQSVTIEKTGNILQGFHLIKIKKSQSV